MQQVQEIEKCPKFPQSVNSEKKTNWWSDTTNWMKKKYFNGTHFLDLALNDEKSDQIYIMGTKFDKNQQARTIYASILWFTYRENLKFSQSPLQSDVGWGCMLRVAQMMMAQVLRINEGLQLYQDEKTINRIINQFIEKQGFYSIQKMAHYGKTMYNKKPGDWYSPSEVAFILRQMQQMNKYAGLKIVVFDNEFQLCQALNILNLYNDTGKKSRGKSMQLQNLQNIKINPGLIIILFRIGYIQPQPQLLKGVITILKEQKNCVGILGGRPGRAHYLIGSTDKSFIYLDPHCVKQQKSSDKFFSETIFSIVHQNIDPSMGICFYVKNTSDLILLHDKFTSKKNELPFYSHSKGSKPVIIEKQQTIQFQLLQDFQKL